MFYWQLQLNKSIFTLSYNIHNSEANWFTFITSFVYLVEKMPPYEKQCSFIMVKLDPWGLQAVSTWNVTLFLEETMAGILIETPK